MSRKLTEQTLCGVRLDAFAEQPTPDELGAIVARWDSEDQAAFLIALGEQIYFTCAVGTFGVQVAYVRDAIAALEDRVVHGYGSALIAELQPMAENVSGAVK